MPLTGRGLATSRGGQFALFLVAGGAVSVWRRKDVNWDLQNYHFYNPWAWLNDRLDFDLAPAQLQSYFSPLLDLPFFALVQANVHPMLIAFLMGIPFGVAVAFYFWIVRFTCRQLPRRENLTITTLSLLVALTGAAGMPIVGSTMNEWHTTALVMPAVFVALRLAAGTPPLHAGRGWLLCGFLLGAAAGLKLTAAPYALAVAIAATCVQNFMSREHRAALLGLILGGLTGFALTYGYWAFVLTKHFGSPVFPFFNALFQSPYWMPVNFRDIFGPKTLLEALLFPFELAKHGMASSNTPQRDPRLALLFVSLVLTGVSAATAKLRRETEASPVDRRTFRFLVAFTVSAYVIWLIQFAIYRYIIPIELIGSFLLVLSVWLMTRKWPGRLVLLAAFCVLIVGVTDRPGWGRRSFGDRYFNVTAPSLPQGSLVLLYGSEPLAYLLPFLGTEHRYVRPSSNLTHPSHSHGFERKVAMAIRNHSGPMYAIRKSDQDLVDEAQVFTSYGLQRAQEPCLPIQSDIHPGVEICRVLRKR